MKTHTLALTPMHLQQLLTRYTCDALFLPELERETERLRVCHKQITRWGLMPLQLIFFGCVIWLFNSGGWPVWTLMGISVVGYLKLAAFRQVLGAALLGRIHEVMALQPLLSQEVEGCDLMLDKELKAMEDGGLFNPDSPLTRAHFMLASALKGQTEVSVPTELSKDSEIPFTKVVKS